MYDVYFGGPEATYHCDESWKQKLPFFPQLGHKVFLKLGPDKYATFKVVDIEWNDSKTVFIELVKETYE